MTRLIPASTVLLALAGSVLVVAPVAAMPAASLPGGELSLQPVNYADVPGSHPRRGGGGKRRGAIASPISPTTPDLKGTSREEADKEYRKKYGF